MGTAPTRATLANTRSSELPDTLSEIISKRDRQYVVTLVKAVVCR
jgi:hypothetical protein